MSLGIRVMEGWIDPTKGLSVGLVDHQSASRLIDHRLAKSELLVSQLVDN